jgi:hypothetical protein
VPMRKSRARWLRHWLFPGPMDISQNIANFSKARLFNNHGGFVAFVPRYEMVWGFASLQAGQSKPVGFLVSNDQLEKLLNAPPKVYFKVEALTAQGNFLDKYQE